MSPNLGSQLTLSKTLRPNPPGGVSLLGGVAMTCKLLAGFRRWGGVFGLVAVFVVGSVTPSIARGQELAGPGGFTFEGKWDCAGSFVQSGRAHRSTYEGRPASGSGWLELVETDIEPRGYVGHYLLRYDASTKQVIELDANSAGFAIYAGPGWEGETLTLTGTATVSYAVPKNRFVFEVKSPEEFSVTWETNPGADWAAADKLSCHRAADANGEDAELAASEYLEPKVQVGQKFANAFSRAIAFRAAGMDDLVRRVSGTAVYTATEASKEKLVFDTHALYDGRPESIGTTEIKDRGRTSCWQGTCATATDASGLLYNALIWGEPSGKLRKGMSWDVTIAQPWELGPAGKETVTVVAIDPKEHAVTLKREGSGEGFFDHDAKQVQLTKGGQAYPADVSPGQAHWIGYTTFREGIVLSDELLVERPVTLTTKELGVLPGTEREYILLNAMPAGSV
jgi:hypothetical protein